MPLGPVQLLVVAFDRPDFSGEALAELERLRENDIVRLLDLLVVHKDAEGVIQRVQPSELAPVASEGGGDVVGALIGLAQAGEERGDTDASLGTTRAGTEDGDLSEFWSVEEAIPNDCAAAIVLVEHRWAIGLRDAIRVAGGLPVADAWVHPVDLATAGLTDTAEPGVPDA